MSDVQATRRKTFYVRSIWDGEAGVYYCESDIIGLHIEAQTLEEFEVLMNEFAPDLVVANHRETKNFTTVFVN